MINTNLHPPATPGMVYRRPGETIEMADGLYVVERVTPSSAACRRAGSRLVSYIDTRTGKPVEFTARFTKLVHISATREKGARA